MSKCNAVQLSDQMTCSCGNVWDMNDPYPPECKKEPTMTTNKTVARYNRKRIGWELERTAMGDGYYGNALRVAKDIPGLTDQDRAVLDRYAAGSQHDTDHIALQDIATKVYTTPQPAEPDEERLALEAVMESVDPATWPGLTPAQRCALGRFAKPQPTEQQPTSDVDVLMRLSDYVALQAAYEEELFCVRQDRDTHFGGMVRALEQVDAMKAECEKLRSLLVEIKRGCSRRDMPSEQTISNWADAITAAIQGDTNEGS